MDFPTSRDTTAGAPPVDRVCMVAYTLYDGDARVRREAELLASTGTHNVRVLSLADGGVPREYVLNGVHVQQLAVRKYRGQNVAKYILSYLRFTAYAFAAMTRLALRRMVDVVHVHNMPNFLIVAALVPMLQRKPVVLDIHDTMPETFAATFRPAYRRLCWPILVLEERICVALATWIIAVNHVQRDTIVGRQPSAKSKTIVCLNVPDPRLFEDRQPSSPAAPTSERFRLVYHGTVSGRLGVDLAIEAVARCSSVIPEVQLHVVGDGDARDRLVRRSEELALGDRVVFHERMPFEQLIPFVSSMDLGMVPLEQNAATDLMLPVKLMECLTLGIPVVAPRLRAIEYYFDARMLFFFEAGDVASLVEAIIRARDLGERSERVASVREVLAKYHWNTHKANLLDVYRSFARKSVTAGTKSPHEEKYVRSERENVRAWLR